MSSVWIMSCNAKNVDAVSCFAQGFNLVVKKTRELKLNDIVFLYMAKPFGRIMYCCRVTNDLVANEVARSNRFVVNKSDYSFGAKGVELTLLKPMATDSLTYDELKKHGVGQLLNPSRISEKTLRHILSVEPELEVYLNA